MFHFRAAILISTMVLSGLAAETNQPAAAPTQAEAMMAALSAQKETNSAAAKAASPNLEEELRGKLELVRTLRFQKSFELAEKQAGELTSEENPPEIRRLAMLEMAYVAQDAGELAKAQAVLGEYVRRHPKDPSLPEVCLRQGLIYRQMGAHQQALSKFYQVMNHALTLKLDHIEYYQALVAKAQTEIAETFYLQGKYSEAAEYFTRLLKLESKSIDRAICHFKLIRSLSAMEGFDRLVGQAQSFIQLYPDNTEVAEVRFLLADALKKMGRNRESMQQVMLLLQAQQKESDKHPELWTYWQQRTGNEIANQLYKEGDYMSALEIYLSLAKISSAASWQLPVWYQIGLVYEHLKQPVKAQEMYEQILKRQTEVRTDSPTPALIALLDMAQWRLNYIKWGEQADQAVDKLHVPPPQAAKETPENAPVQTQAAAVTNQAAN
jgi:tetratricopeptide (TPR) repeat protein